MRLPKYVAKILLNNMLWLCFTMVYSLHVWLVVYLVITLICRHNGTIYAIYCHTNLFLLFLFKDTYDYFYYFLFISSFTSSYFLYVIHRSLALTTETSDIGGMNELINKLLCLN